MFVFVNTFSNICFEKGEIYSRNSLQQLAKGDVRILNSKRNCIYIPGIDAKDLYLAESSGGYSLLSKTGAVRLHRFTNSLDFSLDSEYIRTAAREIYGEKECFSFLSDGKEYSDKIINVTFQYRVEEEGVALSRRQLREYLYQEGFTCNGIHFVRFKRTSGSARVGKCLFIDERLYARIHEWEMCGLKIEEGAPTDLAALESYLSLTASSAIDLLTIDPKSILIIPDCESIFDERSILVEMDEQNRITAKEGDARISNSIFDGQSLIDPDCMGAYRSYGMVLLRNHFFKSCCFNTNIRQWFRDNQITELSQLNRHAVTLAENIEDIKLITTPSSVKYGKFAPLTKWLEQIGPTFSVVKHEKKTPFFHGTMVQAHYQLLNTLPLTPDDIHRLLEPSLHYVNLLNTDTDVLKYHVKCRTRHPSEEDRDSPLFSYKNDIVFTMMNETEAFYRTKYFYDFKKETCKAYLKNIKKGHILINGNYSVLFGNPYEMLLHAIGKFDITANQSSLPPGFIHTKRYPFGTKLLGCRSPHISASNILVSTNMRHDLIDTYFNLTEEIVCINSIGENILERLSGADFDSDQMILTDNDILVRAALKYYGMFQIPANRVFARKSERFYTNQEKADLDYRTSENKIGEIVNLSQELNTLLWDTVHKCGKTLTDCYDEVREIYHDICILNVLSCIEIDKAKKEFDISSSREIREIKQKWARFSPDNKRIKPAFLGYIAQTKGYRDADRKQYLYHDSPMDYLLRETNRYRSRKSKGSEFIPLSECFRFPGFNSHSVNRKQTKQIVDLCEAALSAIRAVWSKEYYTGEEKYNLAQQYRDELAANIHKMKINPHTLFTLITFTDMKKYASIHKLLFDVLFHYRNQTILEIMEQLDKPCSYIKECADGDIHLYGIPFKRFGGRSHE